MIRATISADIIASSSLSGEEIDKLSQRIYFLFDKIREFQSVGNNDSVLNRLILGDHIECYLPNSQDALLAALILKTGIKSFPLDPLPFDKTTMKYRKIFQTYGVRIAIGVGEMDSDLVKREILNGDAINRSGRIITDQKTSNKERVVMKNTLFFDSPFEKFNGVMNPIMSLLDLVFNQMTQKQSEVILWKLLGYNEKEIAKEFGVTQASVNQKSRSSGWSAIEETLQMFKQFDFNKDFEY